jgi:predicted nuclease with TOPRIM domain
MNELWTFISSNFETILGALGLVGGTNLLTRRATKRQAEAQAMKAVQEVYQDTIKDIRGECDYLRENMSKMRDYVANMEEALNRVKKDLSQMKRFKCTVLDCKLRKKD